MAVEEKGATPPLGGTWKDAAGALAKGGIGAIPVVGSLIAEVVGLVIPNQRLNRIEAFLHLLAARLDSEQPERLRRSFDDTANVDLLEEGIVQSVRAISDTRKAYIAQIVSDGINGNTKAKIEAKRVLRMLEDIDDDQVVILASYLLKNRDDHEFYERHSAILEPVSAHLQSDQDELDAHTMYELARKQLAQLGLLDAEASDLTPLGRMLLTRIGLAEPGEF